MSKVSKKITIIVLLVSNLVIFQYFHPKNIISTFLYKNDLGKSETHWVLKEVRGENFGKYDETPKVVEYIYVKKEYIRKKKEEDSFFEQLDITIEEPQPLSKGSHKGKKASMTGKIARVMSGRIIFGRVKT